MANVLGELFTDIANSIRGGLGEIGKMSPSTFPGWIDEIVAMVGTGETGGEGGESASGELKFASGTFSVDADGTQAVVEHGLGSMPDLVIVQLPQLFSGGGTQEDVVAKIPLVAAWGMKSTFDNEIRSGKVTSVYGLTSPLGIDNMSASGAQSGYISCPDETTFRVGATGDKNSKLYAGNNYEWLAVSGIGAAVADPVVESLTITENGTYSAPDGVDGYSPVTVNVPDLSKVIVLEQGELTDFAYNTTFGYAKEVNPSPFTLTVGQTYHVYWDGETFTVTAQDASVLMEGAVFIGDGTPFGLDGNEEPFIIGYINGAVAFSALGDASASHTVGIWQELTIPVVQSLNVTENGIYTVPEGVDGYSPVTVAVSGGSSADVRYVTFMSYDGLVEYGKKAVAVGDDCADPIARGVFAQPTRESDVQYNYTFYGWATEVNGGADANWNKAVTEDKTVYANFSKSVRYYTITYYDSDGATVLKTESLAYGSMPNYTPEKNGYKFVVWEPELAEVTGDTSYISSWVEQLKLADYTWSQINAMTIEEMREKFAIGDIKDSYVLVGFEHDTLVTGAKARMSLIYTSLKNTHTLGASSTTLYTNMTHLTNLISNSQTYVPSHSDIKTVAKYTKKKYVSNRANGEIAEVSQYFWIPSASEFGYIPDGTTVLDEGEHYEAFNEVAFGAKLSPKYNIPNLNLGKRVTRTFNSNGVLYLDSGTAKQVNNGSTVSSVYYSVGFCI